MFSKNSRGKTTALFQNSRSFPKTQCTGGFSIRFLEKKPSLCGKFSLQNLKVMLKTATFWCKKHFLWLKINIYLWNLAIFISKLKYFLQNSIFFQTESKNSRKIQISRPKLNDFDTKTQGTGGFCHLRPLENRTKKACFRVKFPQPLPTNS